MISLKLNKEYAKRHLFVAALAIGLSGWFFYDGHVTYPNANAEWIAENAEDETKKKEIPYPENKITEQYVMCLLSGLFGAVILFRLYRETRKTLVLDNGVLSGTLVKDGKISVADIVQVDKEQWEKKNIAVLVSKYATQIKLDGWHFLGVPEILEEIEKTLADNKKEK